MQLLVGPTRSYTKPSLALAVAQAGDEAVADAADYVDSAYVPAGVTLRAAAPGVVLYGTGAIVGGGLGVLVPQGGGHVIDGLEIRDSYENGPYSPGSQACIRLQNTGLTTLRNCTLHHSDDGVLGGWSGGSLLMEDCNVHDNGTGDGQNHNIYVASGLVTATFRRVHSHAANVGHLLKSRAEQTIIEAGSYEDTRNASLIFDFPEGGDVLVDGAVAHKGLVAESGYFMAYGEEVGVNIPGPIRPITHRLVIRNCVFTNEQEQSITGSSYAGQGLLLRYGPLFDKHAIEITNCDFYWPADRVAGLQAELDALAAAGATITNVRVHTLGDPMPNTWTLLPTGHTYRGRTYTCPVLIGGVLGFKGGAHMSYLGNKWDRLRLVGGVLDWSESYPPEFPTTMTAAEEDAYRAMTEAEQISWRAANPLKAAYWDLRPSTSSDTALVSPLNRPWAPHAFQRQTLVPELGPNVVMAAHRSGWWAYDDATATYFRPPIGGTPPPIRSIETHNALGYDPRLDGALHISMEGDLATYLYKTGTFTRRHDVPVAVQRYQSVYSCYLTSRQQWLLLFTLDRAWYLYDAVTGAFTLLPSPPFILSSFDYSPQDDVVVGVSHLEGQFRVAALDVAALAWTQLPVPATHPTHTTTSTDLDGSPGRLRWFPPLGAFVYLDFDAGIDDGDPNGRTWRYDYALVAPPPPPPPSASLSVTPATAAPGASVTATWSGIATPYPHDWIGLYAQGAPNVDDATPAPWDPAHPTVLIAWAYTGGSASGSLPLVIPSGLPGGAYELRLFPHDRLVPLASAALTVTAPPPPPPVYYKTVTDVHGETWGLKASNHPPSYDTWRHIGAGDVMAPPAPNEGWGTDIRLATSGEIEVLLNTTVYHWEGGETGNWVLGPAPVPDPRDQQIADLQAQVAALQTTIVQKDATIASLNAQVTQLTSDKTALEATVAARDATIVSLNASIVQKDGQIASLQTQLTAAQDEIARQDTVILGLEAEITTFQAQVAQLTSEKAALEADKAALTAQVATLTTEKAALQAEVTRLSLIADCARQMFIHTDALRVALA